MSRIIFVSTQIDYNKVNYNDLDYIKQRIDTANESDYKPVYINNQNSDWARGNCYIQLANLSNPYPAFLKYKHIAIFDTDFNSYFLGEIIATDYINPHTKGVRFRILPIHTWLLNNWDYQANVLLVKSPFKPTNKDNRAQVIFGEPVVSVNYNNPVQAWLTTIQSGSKIMVLFKYNMGAFGFSPFDDALSFPTGRIELDQEPGSFASKIWGLGLPGFPLLFTDTGMMQAFFQSMNNANVLIKKRPNGMTEAEWNSKLSSLMTLAADEKAENASKGISGGISFTAQTALTEFLEAPYEYVPFHLDDAVIGAKTIPTTAPIQDDEVITSVNIPTLINSESYFNLANVLQIKVVSSTGGAFTIDNTNILMNDGNPASGFQAQIILSGGGADLVFGESSYGFNLFTLPDVATSTLQNNYNREINNGTTVNKAVKTVKSWAGNLLDKGYNLLFGGNKNDGGFSINNEAELSKVNVNNQSYSNWRFSKCHIETTYLSSDTKARLNAVYERWGYDDYRNFDFVLNRDLKGFYQIANISDNTSYGGDFSYLNYMIYQGIKEQLSVGVYFE